MSDLSQKQIKLNIEKRRETPSSPDRGFEQAQDNTVEKTQEPLGVDTVSEPIISGGAISSGEEISRTLKIDKILEEGLDGLYLSLDSGEKQQFRKAGEEATRRISELLEDPVKNLFGRILEVVRHWLSHLPHINKYFAEQEAKIKTDKIFEQFNLHK